MKSLKKGLLKKVGHTDGASVHYSIPEDADVFYDAPEVHLVRPDPLSFRKHEQK